MGLPTSPNAPYTLETDEMWPHRVDEASFDSRYPPSMLPMYNDNGLSYAYMPTEYNDRRSPSWMSTGCNDGFFHSRPFAEYNQEPFHGHIEEIPSDDEP